MVERVDSIWMDGEWVAWDQASVHVLTHSLHYGLAVFEGIRCYAQEGGGTSAIFRLEDHVRRLFDSARIATLAIPFAPEQVSEACRTVVRRNGLKEAYIRPLAFVGDGAMGLGARDNATRVCVAAWPWGTYLGEDALTRGIRAKVSSFQRPGVNALMSKGKITGHYVNSVLAKREALAAGYDEAILLDSQGYVCEASGENIFVIRDNIVVTPPMGTSLLAGITRDTVLQLLRELGLTVHERLLSRDELYIADEIFMCGTAAEITPVRQVDERDVGGGTRGPITTQIQDVYFRAVRSPSGGHPEWLSEI
ncbi:MAG: branched-chain amino acid transaminase [Polyangiales bacterium]